MGNRIFYEQILSDSLQLQAGKIVEESDVVTLKDYMQVRKWFRQGANYVETVYVNLCLSIQVYWTNYRQV